MSIASSVLMLARVSEGTDNTLAALELPSRGSL